MSNRIAISTSAFGQASPKPIVYLRAQGFEVSLNPHRRRLSEAETIEHYAGAVGVLAGLEPITQAVFEATTSLRALVRVGIGVDNVDFTAAKTHGVATGNTPQAPTDAVAELTVAAMLSLTRGLHVIGPAMRQRQWTKTLTPGLKGRRVLIVGLGRIGTRVAELLKPFGVELRGVDPLDAKNGIERVELAAGLAWADVVSVHASGKDCVLGPEELDKLQPGAFILNAARGGLVDEGALDARLKNGHIAGTWTDVFVDEPYAGPLCDHATALLTPHVSTYTSQCRQTMEQQAAERLVELLRG